MKIALMVSIILLNIVLLNPAVICMPNPSSVYCGECGGVGKLVMDPDGGEWSICVFPNGSFCEEWALYYHNCSAGRTPAPINYSATLDHFSQFYDLDLITNNQTVNESIEALKDTDKGVRWRAAYILGFMKDKQAIDPLIRALNDDEWRVRERAAWGLGEINDSRSIEPLIQALNDSELRVRYYATWALGKSKNTSAIYPLINALGDDYSIRDEAVNALKSFGTSAVDPLLVALNNSNAAIRVNAAQALGRIGDNRSTGPLINALNDDDCNVQGSAAGALGVIKDPRAVEPLIRTLSMNNSTCAWNIQMGATWSLGELGDSRAIKPLNKLLQRVKSEMPDSIIEFRARDALGKLGAGAENI